MASTNLLPSSIIDPTLAGQRREYFIRTKKAILDGLMRCQSKLSEISYPVDVYLELLEFLVAKKGHYSGLRVYFAAQDECLTLVYVPTFSDDGDGTGDADDRDDLDNCFIFSGDRLVRIPGKSKAGHKGVTASGLVKNYLDKIRPDLSIDGEKVTRKLGFRDTMSLWYKIGIFEDGSKRPGLITYIRDLRDSMSNPLKAIVAQLACYTKADTSVDGKSLEYQLTLLFELRQQKKTAPQPAFFGTKHHDDELRLAQRNTTGATGAATGTTGATEAATNGTGTGGGVAPEDADTGFPCPPYKCGGSLG